MRARPVRIAFLLVPVLLVPFLLVLAFPASPSLSCGWWGDGEDEDDDAIIVSPDEGQSPDRVIARARQLLKTPDDPEALTRTAVRLLGLTGAKGSAALAMELLTRAAHADFAPAQNLLGVLFEQGKGAVRDDSRAAYWFERAARLGDAHAQHSLAMMYYQGRGVPEDRTRARLLLERSARQGHAGACRDLGRLFGANICPPGSS